MSVPKPSPQPRPSTPASTTHVSSHATPRSVPSVSSLVSPTKPQGHHSRGPSGSHTLGARGIGSHPMQRTNSSNRGASSLLGTPVQRVLNGTHARAAGKQPPGKTVPGMSSAAKGLMSDGGSSRPSTPGVSHLNVGSPAVPGASPALSGQTGTGPFEALAALTSPALPGPNGLPGGMEKGFSLSNISGMQLGGTFTGSSGGGKIDDEERRRRLEDVVKILRSRPGNISREAIQRLGRKCGMDMVTEGEDGVTLAGKSSVVIDLHYKPNKSPYADRVALQFATSSDDLTVHADKASRILEKDLSPVANTATINTKLDRFANNLERLASMDKLTSPGADCFDAVFGVYKSLKRLYDHECKLAQDLESTQKDSPERQNISIETMCRRSGRPQMHAGRRVGLSLQYWIDRNRVLSQHVTPANEDKMDVDGGDTKEKLPPNANVYSLVIECEHCPPALYTPIRIGDSWLSERVHVSVATTDDATTADDKAEPQTPIIDWQDPPPTFRKTPEEASSDAAPQTAQLLPHVRFVAHLEPPITLPIQQAADLYASLDLNIQQEPDIHSLPYDSAIFPPPTASSTASNTNGATQHHHPKTHAATHTYPTSSTFSTSSSAQNTVKLDTRLFTPYAEYSVTISKLPFAHPKQLITILPVLRQFAFLARVLANSFGSTNSGLHEAATNGDRKAHGKETNMGRKRTATQAGFDTEDEAEQPKGLKGNDEDSQELEDSFTNEHFIADGTDAEAFTRKSPPNTLDATLTLPVQSGGTPSLEVTFPTSRGLKFCRFVVRADGCVSIEGSDVFDEADQGSAQGDGVKNGGEIETQKTEKMKKLAKALEVCEDLGMWVIWVRQKIFGEKLDDTPVKEVEVKKDEVMDEA